MITRVRLVSAIGLLPYLSRPSPLSTGSQAFGEAPKGVIPINSALRRVLEDQHARMSPKSPDELVFHTAIATPLNDKNLYNRELAPAGDRIKQPRVSWRSFRHTHATRLHANGETLKTAQALLGHSDDETTLKVYSRTVSDSRRNTVERVAGALFGVLDSVRLSAGSAATSGGRPN